MTSRLMVMGIFCALLAAPSARADCHDAGRGVGDSCRATVDAYAAAWEGTNGQYDESKFAPLLADDVQLTSSPTVVGKRAVLMRLRELFNEMGPATYRRSEPRGGHLTVGRFLFFGGTELENVATLRWTGTLTPRRRDKSPRAEKATSVLLRTGAYKERPWQFITLHLERR